MIFRELNALGDWLFGKGINSYARDERAIELNIATRLRSWVGDCFFALQDGIDWASRLDAHQQAALVDELQANILNAFGVVGINNVDVEFDGITRKIRITYDIQTIFTPSFSGVLIQASGTGA